MLDRAPEQIVSFLEWRACVEDEWRFDDLVIHLVRRSGLSLG